MNLRCMEPGDKVRSRNNRALNEAWVLSGWTGTVLFVEYDQHNKPIMIMVDWGGPEEGLERLELWHWVSELERL